MSTVGEVTTATPGEFWHRLRSDDAGRRIRPPAGHQPTTWLLDLPQDDPIDTLRQIPMRAWLPQDLRILFDGLAGPMQSRVADMERARVRLWLLDQPGLTEIGLSATPGALRDVRRWLYDATESPASTEARVHRMLSPYDVEEEIARVGRIADREAGRVGGIRRDRIITRPLAEAARASLRRRYAFGVWSPGDPGPSGLTRFATHPGTWSVPALLLAVLSCSGHLPWWAPTAWMTVALVVAWGLARSRIPLVAMPRLAAAIGVGMLIIALTDEVWRLSMGPWSSRSLWLSSALIAITFGYMVMEVANRGVRLFAALSRALWLTVAGAAHAAAIATLGLAALGEGFRGTVEALWLGLPGSGGPVLGLSVPVVDGHPPLVLPAAGVLLLGSMALFVGVFVQLLWEEQALTERV